MSWQLPLPWRPLGVEGAAGSQKAAAEESGLGLAEQVGEQGPDPSQEPSPPTQQFPHAVPRWELRREAAGGGGSKTHDLPVSFPQAMFITVMFGGKQGPLSRKRGHTQSCSSLSPRDPGRRGTGWEGAWEFEEAAPMRK